MLILIPPYKVYLLSRYPDIFSLWLVNTQCINLSAPKNSVGDRLEPKYLRPLIINCSLPIPGNQPSNRTLTWPEIFMWGRLGNPIKVLEQRRVHIPCPRKFYCKCTVQNGALRHWIHKTELLVKIKTVPTSRGNKRYWKFPYNIPHFLCKTRIFLPGFMTSETWLPGNNFVQNIYLHICVHELYLMIYKCLL